MINYHPTNTTVKGVGMNLSNAEKQRTDWTLELKLTAHIAAYSIMLAAIGWYFSLVSIEVFNQPSEDGKFFVFIVGLILLSLLVLLPRDALARLRRLRFYRSIGKQLGNRTEIRCEDPWRTLQLRREPGQYVLEHVTRSYGTLLQGETFTILPNSVEGRLKMYATPVSAPWYTDIHVGDEVLTRLVDELLVCAE